MILFPENKDGDVTLLGLDIFAAYVVLACISTLYAYWWDIKMDWGFLDHTSTGHKNKYLRDELLYAGGKKVGCITTKIVKRKYAVLAQSGLVEFLIMSIFYVTY